MQSSSSLTPTPSPTRNRVFRKNPVSQNPLSPTNPHRPPTAHPLHPLQNPLPTNQNPITHQQPIRYIRFKIRCQPTNQKQKKNRAP
jgi:hypothetical protein